MQTVNGDGKTKNLKPLKNFPNDDYTFNGTSIAENITGGNGTNVIYAGGGNDVAKGGTGDDTIVGGTGDDIMTGGVGVTKYFYELGDGNDTIIPTKGETLLIDLQDITIQQFTFKEEKGNLVMSYKNIGGKSGSITLKGFASKDITNNGNPKKNITDSSNVLVLSGDTTYDLRRYYPIDLPVTANFTGGWLNENINASGYIAKDKSGPITPSHNNYTKTKGLNLNGGAGNDTITGTQYKDNILGGDGDDSIVGGLGDDNLTGGLGHNVARYSLGDGNDTITLTKSEQFTLELNDLSLGDITFTEEKGNLVMNYNKEEKSGSITLKGFASKDITNNGNPKKNITDSSYVKVGVQDLRDYKINLTAKANFTGGWLNENINASSYVAIDKKTGLENYSNKKGLTLNGGAGNDTITGTKYDDKIMGGDGNDSIVGGLGDDNIQGGAGDDTLLGGIGNDTIKAGAGNDTVIGGAGDDKLYGESGNNTFVFGQYDGLDTIYSGKGNDTLQFDNVVGEMSFVQDSKNKKDLLIFHGYNGSDILTLKNYYKSTDPSKGSTSSFKSIVINGEKLILATLTSSGAHTYQTAYDWSDTSGHNANFEGSKYNDTIRGNDGNDTLNGMAGNDSIFGGTGNDSIFGGAGNDTIFGEAGNDTLNGGQGNDVIYSGADTSLIIVGNGEDSVYVTDGGNPVINAQNQGGKLNLFYSYFSGNTTVQNPANLSEIHFYATDSVSNVISYQKDNSDYVIRCRYSDKTTEITFKNFNYAQQGSMLYKHSSLYGEAEPISSIHVEGYNGYGELIYVEDTGENHNKYIAEPGDNENKYVIGTSTGSDTITTGSGNDYIIANGGYNKITTSGSGTNVIKSGNLADTITVTGSAQNTITAGNDVNVIDATGSSNVITTGEDGDTITSNTTGASTINGGDGWNFINTTIAGGLITTGSGQDTINAKNSGDLIIDAGSQTNYVTVNGGTSVKITTSGEFTDTINVKNAENVTIDAAEGGNKVDVISATGSVSINGGDDNDVINAHSTGNIVIDAGDGSNNVTVEGANVNVTTGDSDDTINATGSGNIVIDAGGGYNYSTIEGTGNLTYTGGDSRDNVVINTTGTNVVDVGTGLNYVYANSGTNTIIGAESTYVTVEGGTNTMNFTTGSSYVEVNEASTNIINFGSSEGSANISDGTNTITGGNSDENNRITISGGENDIRLNTKNGHSSLVTIYGGENSVSTSTTGTNEVTIMGGTNTVTVNNEHDRVYINGTSTNEIIGKNANNTVFVSSDSDNTIYGGLGADYIQVSAGNNTIYGGMKKPVYDGEDNASNSLYGGGATNVIYAGNQGDNIVVGDVINDNHVGNDTIYGNSGNDTINAQNAQNAVIYGAGGNDSIITSAGASTVEGGLGNDNIYIRSLASTIDGGEGNDTIAVESNLSSSATATISGGHGNDYISTTNNVTETLCFKKGDGHDTVSTSGGSVKDFLYFEDSNMEDITVQVVGENKDKLKFIYNEGNSSVTIDDAFYAYNGSMITTISKIKTLNHPEGIALNTFLNQRLIYTMGVSETTFTGSALAEQIIGNALANTIDGGLGNNTIHGGAGNDSIYGGENDDIIYGEAGNDVVIDHFGNNTIIGGAGNDTIDADSYGDSTNILIFNNGDGIDTVEHISSKTILFFSDIDSFDDLNFVSKPASYGSAGDSGHYITYNGGADKVLLLTGTTDNYLSAKVQYKVDKTVYEETIADLLDDLHITPARFVGDCVVAGTDEDEYIYTGTSYSTITGGKGNDTIEAVGYNVEPADNELDNVREVNYVFNVDNSGNGDGHDVIINSNTFTSSHLIFRGVGTNQNDTTAQENFLNSIHGHFAGNDLVLTYGDDSSTITIKNYKEDATGSSISNIYFEYDNGANSSSGYNFLDNIYIDRTVGATAFVGSTVFNERITGTSGNDTINPGAMSNYVDISSGNDVIKITKQYDAQASLINGNNYYLDMGSDNKPDVIWFEDETNTDNLEFYRYGQDLKIYAKSSEYLNYAIVHLVDYFDYAGPEGTPTYMQIKVGDGIGEHSFNLTDVYYEDYSNQTAGLTTITGTVFNDNIKTKGGLAERVITGKGNDTITPYYTNVDPGADTIYAGAGNDEIEYSGSSACVNDGLRVFGEAGNDTIVIPSGIVYGGAGSDSISVVSHGGSDYSPTTIYGGTGNEAQESVLDKDTIQGSRVNDVIYGGRGDDNITGYGGSDLMYGGSGNDTIQAGITTYGISNDPTIYGGAGNDILASYHYRPNSYTDNEYRTSVGVSQYTAYMHGGAGNDKIYSSLIGDKTNQIWGDEGNDTIISYFSSKNDYHFKSGDGNDVIYASNRPYDEGVDRIIFDDIEYDGENILAVYDGGENTLTIMYDKEGVIWNSSITIKDYLKADKTPETCLSMDNIKSSVDKIIDSAGNVIWIRDLIKTTPSDDPDGTIFSDHISYFSSAHAHGGYGSDTIIGKNDVDNILIGDGTWGDSAHYGNEDGGDDYLDGKKGANRLEGGYGNDTLVGGYDGGLNIYSSSLCDDLYGGEGANTYIIKPSDTSCENEDVADIYSISGKDTIKFNDVNIESLSYTIVSNDLKIGFHANTLDIDSYILVKDWKKNPSDFRIIAANQAEPLSMFEHMETKGIVGGGVNFAGDAIMNQAIFIGNTEDNVITNHDVSGTSRLIIAGDGNDSITSDGYNDTIFGGAGNDFIYACAEEGHSGLAYIDGGEGNDTINAGCEDTNYTIIGGAGSDFITSEDGNDVIYTNARTYRETMPTGVGVNVYANENKIKTDWRPINAVEFGEITDTIQSYGGDDIIIAFGENTDLRGGSGDDHYHVTLENNTIIRDTNGSNELFIHAFQNDDGSVTWDQKQEYFILDLNKNGTFGSDGIIITDCRGFEDWFENEGEFSEGHGGIKLLNGIGTVDKIHSAYYSASESTKYLDSSYLDALKTQVTSWLTTANSGAGYDSVKDALLSEEAGDLKAIFETFAQDHQEYWQNA